MRIPGEQLLAVARQNPFPSRLNLEGIPNRDSLKYERLYGLEGIPTMLRGTLRYTGFCELMKCFRSMGLLDTSPVSGEFATLTNWGQVFPKLSTKDLYPKQLEAITWLGLSSNEERFIPKTSMLDSFCELLQKKLKYLPGERDMVVMQHEFIIKRADGGEERKSSSLIEYGDPNGFSAMARTVGYPVVVATEMILDGKVQEVGVIAPLLPSLYNPMLSRLEQLAGITFKECNKGV